MLSKTRFQTLSAYTRKKAREADGLFFVDGWRWLEEVLALPEAPECVLAVPGAARNATETALLERARRRARAFYEAGPAQLARLTGSVQAPGVAALVRWRPAAFTPDGLPAGPGLIVAMDAVQDPGNAGTIVRSADWFGAAGVVFGPGTVEPTNPKLVRSTMGSLFHLPVSEGEPLPHVIGRARAAGFRAVGAALDGEPLPAFRWPERTLLIVGNEAGGISDSVRNCLDARVLIPSYGRAESLNASVAAAVLMAEWRRVSG